MLTKYKVLHALALHANEIGLVYPPDIEKLFPGIPGIHSILSLLREEGFITFIYTTEKGYENLVVFPFAQALVLQQEEEEREAWKNRLIGYVLGVATPLTVWAIQQLLSK